MSLTCVRSHVFSNVGVAPFGDVVYVYLVGILKSSYTIVCGGIQRVHLHHCLN